VAVTVRVMAGRRFEVRDIQVGTGLGRGATRVARSIFAAASSQRFAPETIDLLHRRALDTGIFSRLDVEPVVIGDGALALRVAGAEARPRLLGLYGGYETFLGPILGAEVRHVNFMDTGDALAARAEFRGVGHEGSVQWSDPAWWGSSWALATGLSYETFTFHDYDRETAAWQSALTRRLTRRITAEAFTAVSYNLVNSSVLTAEELGPDEYSSASGGLRLTLDYRDNPVSVRRGWLAGVSVESGVIDGNDTATTSFLQGSFNAAWYQPLGTRWRFALGTHASAITASETDSAIPLDLRNFNGGATSVRSFAERELGPVSASGDTPLGGLASGVVSAELSWEAWRNLEVAAFVDAGTTGAEASSIFTAEDLRYGIGLGLRYRLPVGPLRVDYGVNPDRRDGEAAGALHVTFGFAF
jgi:outer membrane protein assembly factor BamA